MEIMRFFRKNRKYLLWPLALTAVAVLLGMTVLAPPRVQAVRMERRNLSAQVYGNGTVEAKVSVGVSSKITGRIVELFADQGDVVKRGQLLARLENGDLAEQLRQSEAVVQRAEAGLKLEGANLQKALATLELAERNANRYHALAEKNLVSRLEAEQYETAYRVAREEVARSRAALEAAGMESAAGRAGRGVARSRLGDALVYAPQDGVIISREAEKGAVVTPGQAIFTLTDPDVIWVKANVDESQLRGVAVGREAAITLRSAQGESFPGRVARIGRQSDRVTEELEVDVLFTPPLKEFRLGEQADVLIVTQARKGVPSIPSAALLPRGKGRGVWTVADGRLHFREVRVGIEDRQGFSEVMGGIDGSERIVVAAPAEMQKFREGMKVRVSR